MRRIIDSCGFELQERAEQAQGAIADRGTKGKRLYSIEEAARYLGRTPWAIRHLIYGGILPSVKIGRRVQVDIRDLDSLIEKNRRIER